VTGCETGAVRAQRAISGRTAPEGVVPRV